MRGEWGPHRQFLPPHPGLGEFCAWIKTQKLTTTPNLWEFYVKGPESSPDPATWQTELNQPLRD